MRKKSFLVVLALATAFSVASLIFWRDVNMPRDEHTSIVTEARVLRSGDRTASIDISDLVKKYLPIGTTKESAQNYLSSLGFKLNDVLPSASSGGSVLIAVFAPLDPHNGGSSNPLGFHDEIRVIASFDKGSVSKITGQIIFQAP